MAEDCIDRAIASASLAHRPSSTHELRLHGCPSSGPVPSGPVPSGSVPSGSQYSYYGTDGPSIEHLIREQPELGERLHPDLPIRAADVIWAVRKEWARTVEDVLARRNRALFLNARAAIEMAPVVARWMAIELNRDASWLSAQVLAFEQIAKHYVP